MSLKTDVVVLCMCARISVYLRLWVERGARGLQLFVCEDILCAYFLLSCLSFVFVTAVVQFQQAIQLLTPV